MSAIGTKRTFCAPDRMSALGGKADIDCQPRDCVRFKLENRNRYEA